MNLCNTQGSGGATGQSPDEEISPRNLAVLGDSAISLDPKSAQDYVQQTTVLLHGSSWGSTWETPSLNGVLNPERRLRTGTAWESGS